MQWSKEGNILAERRIEIDKDLRLVMLGHEHAQDVFRLVVDNREFLREWLPWVDGVEGIEDTSAFITGTVEQYKKGRGSQFLIESRGVPVGVIGFHPIDWANRNAEIGYWLGEEYTGRGFATRSVEQLLRIGFNELNLNRIEIRCAEGNKLSRAVAERVCMVFEGTLREEEWLYDHYVDHSVFSILKKEFE